MKDMELLPAYRVKLGVRVAGNPHKQWWHVVVACKAGEIESAIRNIKNNAPANLTIEDAEYKKSQHPDEVLCAQY